MPCDNQRMRGVAKILQANGDNLYERLLVACNSIVKLDDLRMISLDSRETHQAAVFIAITGSQASGSEYIEDAYKRGCRLMLRQTNSQSEHLLLSKVEHEQGSFVTLSIYALSEQLGAISGAFYGEFAQLNAVAITGTNGKTSVANLYAQLVSMIDGPSASVGTLGVNCFKKGKAEFFKATINTTPDIVSLSTTFHELCQQQVNSVAIEASSHGLVQNRLANLSINTAIFTNLSQDHLDYHGNMQDYAAAKRQLLKAKNLQNVVLNADDPESLNWSQNTPANMNIFWYSLQEAHFTNNKQAKGCWVSAISYTNNGSEFTLHSNWGKARVKLGLIGEFNVANMLAAVTALLAQNYDFKLIVSHINKLIGVAGRMELFVSNRASILVDYAHTPDALKKALQAARLHTAHKLICVFGCGGDRDKAKRKIMGKIAYELADHVVLTQDNSRSEKPMHIIDDILKGFASKNHVEIALDREQAIEMAWQQSSEEDMIVVAGKGHETYMEIAGKRIPYDERAAVQKIIANSIATSKQTGVGQ